MIDIDDNKFIASEQRELLKNFEVSVVVAAHNEALHLHEAISSILSQVGLSFELIYVDDNSTDCSLEIAEKISKNDKRLKIFKNKNKGKCSAFNYGVSLTSGRFICIFAGDDIMPEGSLEARYDSVAREPDEKHVVGICKLITMSENRKFDGHLIPRAKGRGALSGVSPLMNRNVAAVIFPTPEILPNEDTWMELALLHMPNWKIVQSDTICCRWRVHSGNSINLTLSFLEFNRRISVRMEALNLFMDKFGSSLDDFQRGTLQAKIEMEKARRRGDWFGVLRSNVNFIDRLRAISYTNATMYVIRARLYGLLSGW